MRWISALTARVAPLMPFWALDREMRDNMVLRRDMLRAFTDRELVNTYAAQFSSLLIVAIGYVQASAATMLIGLSHIATDYAVRRMLLHLRGQIDGEGDEGRTLVLAQWLYGVVGLLWALTSWPAYTAPAPDGMKLIMAVISPAGLIIMANTVSLSPKAFRSVNAGFVMGMVLVCAGARSVEAPILAFATLVLIVAVINIGHSTATELANMLRMQEERDGVLSRQKRIIAELDKARKNASRLASTDSLTNLPNRNAFLKQLAARVERAEPFALMLLDVDLFKNINDSLGHHVGDDVLKQVSAAMMKFDKAAYYPARLGGDEFAILIGASPSAQQIEAFYRRLSDMIEARARDKADVPHIGITAGTARFPDDARDGSGLLKAADIAQREAKKTRRGTYQVYHEGLARVFERETVIAQEVAGAIASGEIEMHFQPKVHLVSGDIVGAEILARFPSLEAYPIDDIFAVAEARGLGVALSEATLNAACLAVKELYGNSCCRLQISINLSQSSLKLPDRLIERLHEFIASGIEPQHIRLEITEDAISGRGLDTVLETLERIVAMGFSLSLDDFGTGQASMNHVRQLPIHEIKIDKQFIHEISSGRKDQAIVMGTLVMSRHLGIDCVAEGVETDEQVETLIRMGASIGQGYLWAGPMPVAAFAEFMACFPASGQAASGTDAMTQSRIRKREASH